MILDARISNNITTTDGLTFSNGECTMTTVGGGGYSDGYPSVRPSIEYNQDLKANVVKFTATCPTDTNGLNITRSQIDLTSPSWIRALSRKWVYWKLFIPSDLFTTNCMIAILSIYSSNSGTPTIRPGCFHAFIGDGTEGVKKDEVGFRSNTSEWYPRLVATVKKEAFVDKWVEIVADIGLEGNDKDGHLNIWVDGKLIYSAVRTNTVYNDTVNVHYKIGGLYFWATSPTSGKYVSYSAGVVISDDYYKSFEDFTKTIGANICVSTSDLTGSITCSSKFFPY